MTMSQSFNSINGGQPKTQLVLLHGIRLHTWISLSVLLLEVERILK